MHRYRKTASHADYSWDTPPPAGLSRIVQDIQQSHAEARARKTIAWLRFEGTGYLLLCYEEEGKFDGTGRICEALVLLPASSPPGIEQCLQLMKKDWSSAPDLISNIYPFDNPIDISQEDSLLHILLCENIL